MQIKVIEKEYFNWLTDLVCGQRYSNQISYRKLLTYLHNTEFTFLIPNDQNRAEDGVDLRYRFAITQGYGNCYEHVLDMLYGPCSVLELMIALAIRCEEQFMDDARIGDRTQQWFWGMVVNLGLGGMTDDKFDERIFSQIMCRFLEREYEPDGKGGLFTVRDRNRDLRDVEIWYQLCWYLDSIA